MSEDTDGACARAVSTFVALGEDTLYQVKVLLHSGTLVRVKGRTDGPPAPKRLSFTRLCPLRLSRRRGLHSVVLELLGIEATYQSLALVHLSTGVLYIYVCGVLVEVGTLLRCDE